jgi:enoyl-CoA hydratase
MLAFDNISIGKKDRVVWLTINRPKALNALNQATLAEIDVALEDIRDDAGISGLIVTVAGD